MFLVFVICVSIEVSTHALHSDHLNFLVAIQYSVVHKKHPFEEFWKNKLIDSFYFSQFCEWYLNVGIKLSFNF